MSPVDENTFQSLESAPDSSRLIWETTSREKSFQTPIFGLNKVHRKSRDGREGDFVELDSRDGVNVIPYFIGKDGVARFVMERQFRHGMEQTTLEFPAGLVEKGEDPAVAAARELLEETGLGCGTLVKIGSISQNAAYMNNTIHFFLAEDLRLEVDLADRKLDDFEEIDVVCAPAAQIIDRLGTTELDNAVAVLGGFFFQQEMKRRGLQF